MKKPQTKSHSKEMPEKVKEVAGKVVRIREPGHEGNRQSAPGTIEAAFADLKNEYRKAG